MSDKIRYFTDPANIEPDAVAQIERTASMPFVVGLAVMPDVHYGKGSTVGTVVATEGAIMPACVGVDIGCGMAAVLTTLRPEQIMPHLRQIREGIERRIPVGIGLYGQNSTIHGDVDMAISRLESDALQRWGDVNHMNQRAGAWRAQLGSLGGGNHFIEICVGKGVAATNEENVWVILHSGSRAVGNKTGVHWTRAALKQAEKHLYSRWLPDPDLAYLVAYTDEFHEYMAERQWCEDFALWNRSIMMNRVLKELEYTLDVRDIEVERINCHHNYVAREYHNGKKVWVTRKGAIAASPGMRALIPGSMGARSYIVEGLGHGGAYNSAPHGAGRSMSRNRARKQFTVEQVQREMEAQGIEARVREAIVDEAPGAYKSIDRVMNDARDLIRPLYELRQIINVKGD